MDMYNHEVIGILVDSQDYLNNYGNLNRHSMDIVLSDQDFTGDYVYLTIVDGVTVVMDKQNHNDRVVHITNYVQAFVNDHVYFSGVNSGSEDLERKVR